MRHQERSAGAVVVTTDVHQPEALLLDQTRTTGERQTVAPKGRIEPGESPLAAACREVREETGIDQPIYVAYLGQQSYEFTNPDGTSGAKTVDWFLFATAERDVTPLSTEDFTGGRWVRLDHAPEVASHGTFSVYLRRASDIIAWRQDGRLLYSTTLSDLIWECCHAAAEILSDHPTAGIGLCGSAARGDFVPGWSDVDLIGWRIPQSSPPARQLQNLAAELHKEYGIVTSLRLADMDDQVAERAGSLYDMKLRAVLHRTGADLPVIAGSRPPSLSAEPPDNLGANLLQLYAFAVDRLTSPAGSRHESVDGTRRVLSVASSAGRNVATAVEPDISLRLAAVVARLQELWPGSQLAQILSSYDTFRRMGAHDLATAEDLAVQVPDALDELHSLVNDRYGPFPPSEPRGGG